jgi:hypothetical protein
MTSSAVSGVPSPCEDSSRPRRASTTARVCNSSNAYARRSAAGSEPLSRGSRSVQAAGIKDREPSGSTSMSSKAPWRCIQPMTERT